MYSRQLTGLVPSVQVVQSFSASQGPFAFTLRSTSAHTTDKYFSKHVNHSLSRSFLPIFAEAAIIAIGSYVEMGGVWWFITRLAHAQWC